MQSDSASRVTVPRAEGKQRERGTTRAMPGRPEVGRVSKNWGPLLVGLYHENYKLFGGVLYFMVTTMCFEDGKVEGVVIKGLEGIGFLKEWVFFPPANAGVEILDWRRWAEKHV